MSISHWYGNDLQRSASGSLLLGAPMDNVAQRILRALLTAAGDYIWHTGYGIGAGAFVGPVLSPAVLQQIKMKFRGQILGDPAVARNPAPTLTFNTSTPKLLGVTISYTYALSGQVQTLSFNVSE